MTRTADCREVNELLPWYITHTLDEEEGARVRVHLERCEWCRAELSFVAAVHEAIRQDEPTPDAHAYGIAGLRFLESLFPPSSHLAWTLLRVSQTLDDDQGRKLVMDWMPSIARDLMQTMVA